VLDADRIRSQSGELRLVTEIRALTSVSSTSDIAWAWAEAGCAEGMVVVAEEQVQGRGRFGRVWHCPRGRGLLMSVVLRPPAGEVGPEHLTAVGALATAEAVEETAGLAAAIRWPNDVTVGGRKLAGVLVERRSRDGAVACVLGIGLNVNVARTEFPAGLSETAASLASEAGREFAIEDVAAALLRRLDRRYGEACGGGWPQVAAAWRGRSALEGSEVEVETEGQRLRGRVLSADPLGGLELELAGGQRIVCRPAATTLLTGEPEEGEGVACSTP